MEREEKQSSYMNLLSFCDRYKIQKESRDRPMRRVVDVSYTTDDKNEKFKNVQIQFSFPAGKEYGELLILDEGFIFEEYYSYFRTDFQKFVYRDNEDDLLIIEGNTESKKYKTYTVRIFNVRVVDN